MEQVQPLRRSARLTLAPIQANNFVESTDHGDEPSYGPPRKKARKSKGTTQKPKKKLNSLSLLPELPLDVLFEIFGWLDFESLLNLALVSRLFWDTLRGNGAKHLWLRLLERWEAPEAPTEYTTMQWAVLLLGKPICRECKRESAAKAKLDFLRHRRYCNRCLGDKLFPQHRVKKVCKDMFPFKVPCPADVLALLYRIEWRNLPSGFTGDGGYFLKEDLQNVVDKIMSLGGFGSEDALAFMEDRMRKVIARLDYFPVMLKWRLRVEALKEIEANENLKARQEEIVNNMVEYGYTREETKSAMICVKSARTKTKLTKAVWTKMRPKLENGILVQRHREIYRNHRDVYNQRRSLLESFYDEFKKTISPQAWRHLPLLDHVMNFMPVRKWRTRDVSLELTQADLNDITSDFRDAVQGWQDDVQKSIDKIQFGWFEWKRHLPAVSPCLLPPLPSPLPTHLPWNVFKCISSGESCIVHQGISFGQDELLHHRILCGEPAAPLYGASTAAAIVIQLAGKDIFNTTALEMDQLDLRFVCLACENAPSEHKIDKDKTVFGVKALSWRECALHHIGGCSMGAFMMMRSHNESSKCPIGFRLATTDEVAAFAWQDVFDRHLQHWTCAMCSKHYKHWKTLKKCCRHVKKAHNVDEPKLLEHVVLRQGVGYYLPPTRVIEKTPAVAAAADASLESAPLVLDISSFGDDVESFLSSGDDSVSGPSGEGNETIE